MFIILIIILICNYFIEKYKEKGINFTIKIMINSFLMNKNSRS